MIFVAISNEFSAGVDLVFRLLNFVLLLLNFVGAGKHRMKNTH